MNSTQTSPLSPSTSFRRVRAILSPLGSPAQSYTSMADALHSPNSTRPSSPSRYSTGSSFSNISSSTFGLRCSSIRSMLIRRKPSAVEMEFEEERKLSCAHELLGLVEPRPAVLAHVGGIDEMLFGRL